LDNIVEVLRCRAEEESESGAYVWLPTGEEEGPALTYSELDRRAKAVAALLQSHGLAGERALLFYGPGLEFLEAFFGCLYANVVPAPLYAPRSARDPDRLKSICQNAEARAALTRTRDVGRVENMLSELPTRPLLFVTDSVDSGLAAEWKTAAPRADGLAYLQYTSGSTTTPRGVMVGHANLVANLQDMQVRGEFARDTVWVSWLPHFHDMGLVLGMLEPLYTGYRAILFSPSAFGQRPLRWLQTMSRYRGTHSAGPNFAYDLCAQRANAEDLALLDLSSWRATFNGAEPVRKESLERFARTFASCGFRWEAMCPCYGLAEATLMVTSTILSRGPVFLTVSTPQLTEHKVRPADPKETGISTLVGCGSMAPSTRVVIVNPTTQEVCKPDEIGEIWVNGPGVCLGYWNQPEDTERVFRARLSGRQDGPFLRTGDLGFFREQHLYITGRLKDCIIIRGQNHYPQDIEKTVEDCHPGLQRGGGAAFSVQVAGEEQLAVAHELRRGEWNTEEVVRAVRGAVSEVHGLKVYAVVLLRPATLPKTTSGKVQRHECQAEFLAGTLSAVACHTLPLEDVDAVGADLQKQLEA